MAAKSSTEYVADPANDTRDFTFHPADPGAAKTLSPAQVEQFNREGFLSPLPGFEADDTARIRGYFDELMETVTAADDRRNPYSINFYHLVCAGVYDLIHTPIFLDYVQDIIGPDFIAWGTQVFCKMPGDPMAVPLHQDANYWAFAETKSVTVWLALDDVDDENSAMHFIPGSHLLGSLPHEVHKLDGTRVLKRQVVGADRYTDAHVNAMTAGQVSLHNDLLLHGSRPNVSLRRRAGFTIRYTASDVGIAPGGDAVLQAAVHCRGNVSDQWPNAPRPDGEHSDIMANYTGNFDGNMPDPG